MTSQMLNRTARQLMTSPPVTVSDDATLAEAAQMMIDKNIGCLPVIDSDGRLLGMVTERVFEAQLAGERPRNSLPFQERVMQQLFISGHTFFGDGQDAEDVPSMSVTHAMLTDVPTVNEDTQVWQIADLLLKGHGSHMAVVRDGKPVGVISRHDLLRAYTDSQSTAA